MAITLDHTIVPAHDRAASAKFFADLFGLACDAPMGPFAPVRVNETLTFDFDDRRERFEVHHYAFHVSEGEFDGIFGRVKDSGRTYGSQPWSPDDMQVRRLRGGRTVYFHDLDGHLLEIRTRTSRREAEDAGWNMAADRENKS